MREAIADGEREGQVIATDCAVAMKLIENAFYDDTSMHGAAEEDVLRLAVRNIKKLTGKTQLIKVRGHVGIEGNEQADKAADVGREMEEPDSDSDDESVSPHACTNNIRVVLKTDGSLCSKKNKNDIIKQAEETKMLAKAATARARATYQRDLTIPEKWSRAAIAENLIPPTHPAFKKTYIRESARKTWNRCKVFQWHSCFNGIHRTEAFARSRDVQRMTKLRKNTHGTPSTALSTLVAPIATQHKRSL
jgi:hypothetical protein